MSDLSVAFGWRLRKARAELGMSQDDLAKRTGMRPSAIGRLERGCREPRISTALRLADGLGMKPGHLLDDLEPLRERRLTPEEFKKHFGDLPTDGEG